MPSDQFRDRGGAELQQQRQPQESQDSNQHLASIEGLIEGRRELFQAALDAYFNNLSPQRTSSNPVGQIVWDDIQRLMRKAEADYRDAGRVRKHLRKFGENAAILNSELALLAQASYPSTIYGGYKVIFHAAEKLPDAREKLFEILSEIPDRISRTQVYAELYQSSQRVQMRSAELHVAILDIFEYMLGWLAKKPSSTRNRQRDQSHSVHNSEGLSKKASMMKSATKNVMTEVKLCLHESLKQVNFEIRRNSHREKCSAQKLTEIRDMVCQLLQSAEYVKDIRQGNTPHLKSGAPGRVAQRTACSTELLKSLSFSPDDLVTAVHNSLRRINDASPMEKDRADWILKSPHMRTWNFSQTPRTLLVNGNGELEEISLLSHITALLIATLTEHKTPALHFFCGHAISSGGGPSDLMRSLIAQLLTHYHFDLTAIWPLREGSLRATHQLCNLIEDLFAQLPDRELIFILIDGITYFENETHWLETILVIEKLHEITQGTKALIKVLVMAPTKSRYVFRKLQSGGEGGSDGEGERMNEGSSVLLLDVPVNPHGRKAVRRR